MTNQKKKLVNVYPLHDGVIVKAFIVQEKTEGGLFIPDEVIKKEESTMKDDTFREVVAVGPECVNIKVGDKVMFCRTTPYNMMLEDVAYMQFFEHQAISIHSLEKRELKSNSHYIASFRQ